MFRKISEITFEGIHYLSCKAHKFENQLIITINDTINKDNNDNYNIIMIVIIVIIIVVIVMIMIIITINFNKKDTITSLASYYV